MMNTLSVAKAMVPAVKALFNPQPLSRELTFSMDIYQSENEDKMYSLGRLCQDNAHHVLSSLARDGMEIGLSHLRIKFHHRAILATQAQTQGLNPVSSWVQPELWSVTHDYSINARKWEHFYLSNVFSCPLSFIDELMIFKTKIENIQQENPNYSDVSELKIFLSVTLEEKEQ